MDSVGSHYVYPAFPYIPPLFLQAWLVFHSSLATGQEAGQLVARGAGGGTDW